MNTRRLTLLSRVRRALGNEQGDMVVDAMVGVLISGLVLTAIATISISAAVSTEAITANSQRVAFLNSVNAQAVGSLDELTGSPVTKTVRVGDQNVDLTQWKDTTGPAPVLYAAMSSYNGKNDYNCSSVDALTREGCMTRSLVMPAAETIQVKSANVTWANAAVTTRAGVPLVAGELGSVTAPLGAEEVRYVVKVTAAATAGTITFTNGDDTLLTVPFTAGADGYLYGSVWLQGAPTAAITLNGSATISDFLIYEAPTS